MALRIVVSDRVRFKVSGKLRNEEGTEDPFSFEVLAKRIKTDELSNLKDADQSVADFLATVIDGWSGVQDASGANLAFSPEALGELLKISGMATFIFSAYIRECGPREKN